jgi:hypothetical protein
MYQPIFKENYKGRGAWARAGAVFNRLGRFCNNIYGSGGITITPNAYGGLDISGGGGGSASFSGVVYLAGKKYELNGTSKAWIRVFISPPGVVYDDGPPPDPFPPGEEWYATSSTAGDIHIPRFG